MTLKWAMLKAFECAVDNNTKECHDIFIFSKKHQIHFSIFDRQYDYEKLKEYYNDITDDSFEFFVTAKKAF